MKETELVRYRMSLSSLKERCISRYAWSKILLRISIEDQELSVRLKKNTQEEKEDCHLIKVILH